VQTEPEENIIGSVEEETNESECSRMNSDEPMEEEHHIFVCEHCGKILSWSIMRSHGFILERDLLHVVCVCVCVCVCV
jgi:Fe2+ or Zn2+ uptake regulation protein